MSSIRLFLFPPQHSAEGGEIHSTLHAVTLVAFCRIPPELLLNAASQVAIEFVCVAITHLPNAPIQVDPAIR